MDSPYVVFILAAGASTRMKTHTSKLLLPLGGQCVLDYVLNVAHHWSKSEVYGVISPAIEEAVSQKNFYKVIQKTPKGTGDAFILAFQAAQKRDPHFLSKTILVLLGDTPLIEALDLEALIKAPEAPLTVIGMHPPKTEGYGRLCMEKDRLMTIIEERNASSEQRALSFCNTGVMRLNAACVAAVLPLLRPNPLTGEYYLTDLVKYLSYSNAIPGYWKKFLGLNTLEELAQAEEHLQERFRRHAMHQGALLVAPSTTFLSYDTRLAPDVRLYPYTFLGPQVVLDQGVHVHSFSSLSGCHIKQNASIGPFAHIRSGTEVGEKSHIGNFVETKNTIVGVHSKVKHLSYIGDSTIGNHVNIGAGVVTCNYDGLTKHKTSIEDNVFIGSNSALVAPLTLQEGCTIGAGSVITKNVPPFQLALSRTPQKSIALPVHHKHRQRAKPPSLEKEESMIS